MKCLAEQLRELIELRERQTTNLAEQLRELQYQGVQATLLICVCAIVLHMGQ